MTIVDGNGLFLLEQGTLSPVDSDNPVYKARIALALSLGGWMFAPDQGHQLAQYDRALATDAQKLGYQKAVELYLKPYGPSVLSRLSARGVLMLEEQTTKETI